MLQAMNGAGLQFSTDNGLQQAAPTRNPGMDQQARWIDLQIFAVYPKRCAIIAHTPLDHFPPGRRSAFHSVMVRSAYPGYQTVLGSSGLRR